MQRLAPSALLALLLTCSLCVSVEPSRSTVPAKTYQARDAAISSLRDRLTTTNEEAFEGFLHRSPTGRRMFFRLFVPEAKAGEKLPLVLVLHGSGSRGMDNLAPILGANTCLSAGIWTLPENQSAHPCFVLVPQCPPEPDAWIKTGNWTDTSRPFREKPTAALELALEILDQVCRERPIDQQRIYVVGASMGGYGTWDLLTRFPGRFAAAVPVCGELADGRAERIKHVPVWIFHGAADDVVPVRASRRAWEQLRAAGGTPRYTEYESGGHQISPYAWTEPGLIEWLFAQRRAP